MIKVISTLTLIYIINVSAQRYAPRSVLGEELQHHHPCTRRKDVPYENPVAQAPSFITRVVIPNKNINVENFFEPAPAPTLLKNHDKIKITSEHQQYPLHGEFFRNNQEIILFPQTDDNEEENANTNSPKPLLISNESDKKGKISLPKPDSKNEADELVFIGNDTLIATKTNPHEYENMLLQKNKKVKPQEPTNEKGKEKTNKVFNDCISKTQSNEEDVLETRRFLSNANDLEENILVPKRKNKSELSEDADWRLETVNNEKYSHDPAKGAAVSELSSAPVNLLTHRRVCYACSSVSNPTCWHPDRRTTVKYCRIGHEACVTKTFQTKSNNSILTRDCGKSCDDTDIPGPKYKSCSVCHSDMCNDSASGSQSIKADSIMITIFIVFIVKSVLKQDIK